MSRLACNATPGFLRDACSAGASLVPGGSQFGARGPHAYGAAGLAVVTDLYEWELVCRSGCNGTEPALGIGASTLSLPLD